MGTLQFSFVQPCCREQSCICFLAHKYTNFQQKWKPWIKVYMDIFKFTRYCKIALERGATNPLTCWKSMSLPPHMPTNSYYQTLKYFQSVKQYLMIFPCISLLVSRFKNLFCWSLFTYVSFYVNCIFVPFDQVSGQLLVFSLLSFRSSLSILGAND